MKPRINLQKFEDCWETEMGGAIPGERVVVRGKDLFKELKDYSWLQLLLYVITGREFGANELDLLDKLWAYTISYPDPRIWNNRIGALAGTVRSTCHLGVGAGCAVSEAKIYGGQPNIAASSFIIECAKKVDKGESLKKIIQNELRINRAIYGYGRPIVARDERIVPVEELMKKNGYGEGKHVVLAYEIEDVLKQGRWRMQMNIAALGAAITADMGFSAREFYLWLVNGYNAGITACYIDASNQKEGTFFPLSCGRIAYSGVAKRTWD